MHRLTLITTDRHGDELTTRRDWLDNLIRNPVFGDMADFDPREFA